MNQYLNSDEQKLIFLVKQHPALFNVNHQDYYDSEVTTEIWKSIAQLTDFDVDGIGCMYRWQALKATYSRMKLSLQQNHEVCNDLKQNDFYQDMAFLENFPISNEEEHPDINCFIGVKDKYPIVIDDCCISERIRQKFEEITRVEAPAMHGIIFDVEAVLLNLLAHQAESCSNFDRLQLLSNSSEMLFFKSCTVRLKRLSPRMRTFIRLQISELFFNAENHGLLKPVPITPLSLPLE